jgi:dihydroflavonol-4-reductase
MGNNQANCLVTGATGYLGSVLVKMLHDHGHKVTSLVLLNDDASFASRFSEVRFADICDMAALERVATGFDVVVHLAGIVDVGTRNRALMRPVNIGGTPNVAELCLKHRMKMLYCGSVHAIPCLPDNQTMAEPASFDPRKVKGLYSQTKAEAGSFVLEAAKRGLDAMIALPSGIIGPYGRRPTNIEQLIVDFLCGGLRAYVNGQYNFVDVRDVAGGICAMLENWSSGECYTLSGHVVTVEQMLAEIAEASGQKMLHVRLPYWFALGTSYLSEAYYHLLHKKPLYTRYSLQTLRNNCHFTNQKAREAFGFTARPSRESLSDMTRWVMEHFVEKKGEKYRPCAYREQAAHPAASVDFTGQRDR